MKKLTSIFLVAMTFYSTILFGQTNKLDVGLEFGPSLMSLRGNDFLKEYYSPTIRYSAGFSFQYNFSKLLSIRSNITYEAKGGIFRTQFTDMYGNLTAEATIKSYFDYITVPLLARLTLGDNIKFFVNAGPYFGYLLRQINLTDFNGNDAPYSTTDIDYFKRSDFGITAGFGAQTPIKEKLSFSLEIRNNLGFSDIDQVFPTFAPKEGATKTNSTNLLLGVVYHIGAGNKE